MVELQSPKTEFVKLVLDVLQMNEIGSDDSLAYKFSDPDGLNNGKSEYSFSSVQFDIGQSWKALDCLRECGFTLKDLARLYRQDSDISDLNEKLKRSSDVVDRFALEHARKSIVHCMDILSSDNILVVDFETLIHIVDYHNQLYMSRGGKLHKHLRTISSVDKRAIVPEDILDFKLGYTKWGRINPRDIKRRFDNILGFCRNNEERFKEVSGNG